MYVAVRTRAYIPYQLTCWNTRPSSRQEISHLPSNSKAHYKTQLLLDPIQSQLNPVLTYTSYFKIHFNSIFPSYILVPQLTSSHHVF